MVRGADGTVQEMGGLSVCVAEVQAGIHQTHGVPFSVPGGAEGTGILRLSDDLPQEKALYRGAYGCRQDHYHRVSRYKSDGGGAV